MKCPACGHENIAGEEDCLSCSAPLSQLSLPRPEPGLKEKILAGTISDLKPRAALTVTPQASIRDAVELMRKNKVGCALILKPGKPSPTEDSIAGMLTERDLLLGVAGLKDPAKTRVRDIMRADPLCLKAGDPVSYAFHHMAVGGYRHLPVRLEDGSAAVVSARDLLAYLTQ